MNTYLCTVSPEDEINEDLLVIILFRLKEDGVLKWESQKRTCCDGHAMGILGLKKKAVVVVRDGVKVEASIMEWELV
jgi:hypothetical protein